MVDSLSLFIFYNKCYINLEVDMNNCNVQEYDGKIVLTTNDRATAKLLESICTVANETDNENEYHYQGMVLAKQCHPVAKDLPKGYKALELLLKLIRPNCFNYHSAACDYHIPSEDYDEATKLFNIVHNNLTGEQAHDYIRQNYN